MYRENSRYGFEIDLTNVSATVALLVIIHLPQIMN